MPRRSLHVEPADLGVLGARRAAAARRRGGAPRRPRRCRRRAPTDRRVRHLREQRVARGLGGRELLLGRCAAPPSPACSSSSCSGVGLPLSFVCARSSSTFGHERAPALVGREQRVERLGRALARERGAVGVRVGAGGAEVDHGRESRSASSTAATPSSSAGGQIQSATAFSARVRVLDRDPVAGPLEQLDVVLAVAERDRLRGREAEPLGEEVEPGALRDARARELEEVRQRLRDEEPVAEVLLAAQLERRRAPSGSPTRRASSAARSSQASESPTGWIGGAGSRVRARPLGHART